MKARMIEVIQNVVDAYKEAREDGNTTLKDFHAEQMKYFMAFFKQCTGEEIVIKNWKVMNK